MARIAGIIIQTFHNTMQLWNTKMRTFKRL